MAGETNTVLKHFQIFRNASIGSYSTYAEALTAAKGYWESPFVTTKGLKDGEFVLFNYTLGQATKVESILGIVRSGAIDIIGSYDQLTSDYQAYVASAINALDTTKSNVTALTNGATTTDIRVEVVETDGIITAVKVTDTLAKVAHSGEAGDVTVATIDGLVAENVQDALEKLADGIAELDAAQLSAGNGINITNHVVSAQVAENEKVLSVGADGLATTLNLTYDSDAKEIKLWGISTTDPIATVDATDFIKDGMLSEAELVTNPEGKPAGEYIKLTFNADAEQDPIYINVADLCDVYRVKENDWIQLSDFEFSHKTSGVTAGTYAANAANVTVDSTDEKSFKVPTLTVDAAGHVTAASEKTVTITLPASIDSAVQTINGHNLNDTFITTTVTPSTDNKTQSIEVTAKIGSVGTATDGLATASDVQTYVDTNITTAIEALNVDPLSLTTLNGNKLEGYQISEVNGKIVKGETANPLLTFATAPTADNKVATQAEITNAIEALDAEVTSADETNVQVKVTEVNGVITAVNVTTDNTINETDLTNAINALDSNATIASVAGGVVTLKAGIAETDGKIANNTEADITLAKLATTGDAADVAISDADSLYTATNVEAALAEVMTKANALQNAQLSAGTGIEIDADKKINANFDIAIETRTGENAGEYIVIKDGENVIAEVNANAFVKDGFLQSVTKNEQANTITFTWNTDAGVQATTISIKELCDVYTADETYLHLENYKFSHKTQTGLPQESIGSVDFSQGTENTVKNAGDAVEINVPKITVDAAGHVTTLTETTVGIILPTSIATAIQAVTGESETDLNNSDFVNVKATRTDNNIALTSSVKTQDVATATEQANGLATAHSVKTYVDTNITTAIDGLDADVTNIETLEGAETTEDIKVSISEVNGKLTSVTVTDTLAKVAHSGAAADVTYTRGSGETVTNISVQQAISDLEAVDTWDAGTY